MIKEEANSDKSILSNRSNSLSYIPKIFDPCLHTINEDSNGDISFKTANRLKMNAKSKYTFKKNEPRDSIFQCSDRSDLSESKIKTIHDYKYKKKEYNKIIYPVSKSEDNNPAQWVKLLKHSQSKKNKTEKRIRIIEIIIALLAVISLILSAIDNEVFTQKTINYFNNYQKTFDISNSYADIIAIIDKRKISLLENVIRIFDMVISIITCCCIIWNYKLINQRYKEDNYHHINTHNALCSNKLSRLVFNLLVHIVFYPPMISVLIYANFSSNPFVFSLNTVFFALHIPKLISLNQAIVQLSKWNNDLAKSICKNNQITFGFDFITKCHLQKWSFFSYPIKIVSVLIISSLLLHNFEFLTQPQYILVKNRLNNNNLHNLYNCIWLIAESMIKLSIGDYYPLTFFGYCIIFVSNAIGVSLIVIAISSMYQSCNLTIEEKKAYEKLTKLFDRDNDENKAVNVVKTILYLRKLSKQKNDELTKREYNSQKFILLASLRTNVKYYANDYTIAHSYSLPVYDLFESMENKIEYNIIELNEQVDKLNTIDNDLEELALGQECIQCSLRSIKKMEKEIRDYVISTNNELFKVNTRQKSRKPKSSKVFSIINPSITSIPYRTYFLTTKFPQVTIDSNFAPSLNNFPSDDNKSLCNYVSNQQKGLIEKLSPNPLLTTHSISKPDRNKKKKISKIVSNIMKQQKISMTSNIPKKIQTQIPSLLSEELNSLKKK